MAASLEAAREFNRQDNGEGAVPKAKEALEAFTREKNTKGAGEALLALAEGYISLEDYEEAKKVINGCTEVKGYTQLALGQVLVSSGFVAEGVESAEQALAVFENDKAQLSAVQCVLSSAKLAMGGAGEAFKIAQKAVTNAKLADDSLAIGNAFFAVMSANIFMQDHEKAADAGEQATFYFKECGEKKKEAMVLLTVAQSCLAQGKFPEAITKAKKALGTFRQVGSAQAQVPALDTLVTALINKGEGTAALREANAGVDSIRKSGNRRAEADSMQSLVSARSALNEKVKAMEAAQEGLSLARKTGSKQREADWLCEVCRLSAIAGKYDESEKAGNEALGYFKSVGNKNMEREIMKMLSSVADTKANLPQILKEREEALQALERLADAVDMKNGPAFQNEMENLYNSNYATQEDIYNKLAPIIQKDPDNTWDFFREFASAKGRPTKLRGRHAQTLYMFMRIGGMGYGPHFRLMRLAMADGAYNTLDSGAGSIVQINSDTLAWESEVKTHAGILDCALQTGAAWI